jgi:hypothetical protein
VVPDGGAGAVALRVIVGVHLIIRLDGDHRRRGRAPCWRRRCPTWTRAC